MAEPTTSPGRRDPQILREKPGENGLEPRKTRKNRRIFKIGAANPALLLYSSG
jgi:hypothetical protein